MEFEFNAENLSKPWFRLVIGIIFVVAGIFCFTDMYSGITRENCVEAEVTLYEMRVDLTDTKNSRDIWLIFEDYDDSLNIHPSCVTDEFLSDMLTLKKGAKMKILHSTKNSNIYELWVNDEKWLDFDTANQKINENANLLKYAGYGLVPVGAIFIISVILTPLFQKSRNRSETS